MDEKISLKAFIPHFNTEELERMFQTLMNALRDVQLRQHGNQSFEEIYRYAYNLVLHKQGQRLYNAFTQLMTKYLKSNVLVQLLNHLDKNFLPFIDKIWCDYQAMTENMSEVLNYLDRVHLKHQQLASIKALCAALFRDYIIQNSDVRATLCKDLLRFIAAERRGAQIDQRLIKKISEMLLNAAIDSRESYVSVFESAFLSDSANYFERLSEQYLAQGDACIFFRKVEKHFVDECLRARLYLDRRTEPHIVQVIEKHLIRKGLRVLIDMKDKGVYCMLKNSSYSELALMYKVFSMLNQGGVQIIAEILAEYIDKRGLLMKENKQGICYVETLLHLKDQLNEILTRSFNGNKFLQKQIASNLKHLINLESNSAEYLSLFLHEKLVISASDPKQHTIFSAMLCKVLTFHQYLKDKDVFQRIYETHFARRLLMLEVLAEDLEMSVIEHLRTETGSTYMGNLDIMWKDITSSKTINDKFKKLKKRNSIVTLGFDLCLNVVRLENWPIKNRVAPSNFPSELLNAFDAFKLYYTNNNPHKQLNLHADLGIAEMRATFYDETGEYRSYILYLSTQQMGIIMLFDRYKHMTFDKLLRKTGLCDKDLTRELSYLTAGPENQRLLIARSKTHSTTLVPTDVFSLNYDFCIPYKAQKYYSVRSVESAVIERKKEMPVRQPEDQHYEINAAIVRLMKAAGTLSHDVLISKIKSALINRFVPTHVAIKIQIEKLIAQDYIARSEEKNNVYNYLP